MTNDNLGHGATRHACLGQDCSLPRHCWYPLLKGKAQRRFESISGASQRSKSTSSSAPVQVAAIARSMSTVRTRLSRCLIKICSLTRMLRFPHGSSLSRSRELEGLLQWSGAQACVVDDMACCRHRPRQACSSPLLCAASVRPSIRMLFDNKKYCLP